MLKNQRFSTLLFGIFTSILMPVSILGIVMFAISKKFLGMGICIALVMFSFYSLPFIWIRYGRLSRYMKVYKAIEEANLKTLKEIATFADMSEEDADDAIKRCISYGYIQDKFYFDKTISNRTDMRVKNNKISCPSCGASEFKITNGFYVCEYCGQKLRIKK